MIMVQKTPSAKQVNVATTATKVDGVKLKNRDSTDRHLPPAKYWEADTKCSPPSRRNGSSKKAKANREDILATKKRQRQTPPKQAKLLESAVATKKRQISSLTARK